MWDSNSDETFLPTGKQSNSNLTYNHKESQIQIEFWNVTILACVGFITIMIINGPGIL